VQFGSLVSIQSERSTGSKNLELILGLVSMGIGFRVCFSGGLVQFPSGTSLVKHLYSISKQGDKN